MIRLPAVLVSLDTPETAWPGIASGILRIPESSIRSCRLVKRSVDARRKDDIRLSLTLDVEVAGDASAILQRCQHPQASIVTEKSTFSPAIIPLSRPPVRRPIVVGSGPAGLFAALTLAQAGARPLLIERGQDAITRKAHVDAFWQGGALNPESNVQFGEGGAGTFSDGKLNTGIKDPRCRQVLQTFVACGAPEEILWQAKPHVGTDHLVQVVQAMRARIEALGGTIRFGAKLSGLQVEDDHLHGVHIADEGIDADTLLLCVGHSARDTFEMLQAAGVTMQAKPFSIGARIEHPQALINKAQYGRFAAHPALGAAEYKLSTHLPNGRGVYTFCMCPGGLVVAAASEEGGVVTNGMSYFARDAINANSALLVDVRPEDYGSEDPLAGMHFQRIWEQRAFAAGGGQYHAPAQRVEDFLTKRSSRALSGTRPSYQPGVVPSDLRACLPGFVADSIAEALPLLDRRLQGFADPDAVLTGVETRSSSPVRILRDAQGQSNIRGLFPAGEGAGYAGGIVSAAVDGIRAAEHALSRYQSQEVSP